MPLTHRRHWLIVGGVFAVAAVVEGPALLSRRHGKRQPDGRKRSLNLIWPDAPTDTLLFLARSDVFARYNLDITVLNAPSGDAAIHALREGTAQAAAAPLVTWVDQLKETPVPELPGHLICGLGGGGYRLLVNSSLGIHKAGALRSHTIGIAELGGATQLFAEIQIRRRGMNPETDVNWIVLSDDELEDALRDERVDAIVAPDPLAWNILRATRHISTDLIDSLRGAERDRTNLALALSPEATNADPDLADVLIQAFTDAAASWPRQQKALAAMLGSLPEPVASPDKFLAQAIPPEIVTGHDLVVQTAQFADELKLIGRIDESDASSSLAHRLCLRVPQPA